MRKWQPVPGRPADRLRRRRVVQEGCAPGATDGSTPVGSVRLFMHFSSSYRTGVLPYSGLPPITLFRNCLLIPTLRTQTEKMALTVYISLFILAQMPSIANKAQRVEPDTPCTGLEKLSHPTPSPCERNASRSLPCGASRSIKRANNQPRQAAGAYLRLWQS